MGRRAKGTGYLKQNKDGTKTLRKSVINPKTGKTMKIQVTAATETACNRLMKDREKEFEELRKANCITPDMTVAQLCYKYSDYKYRSGFIKKDSKDREDLTTKNQIEAYKLGHLQIGTVTSRDINDLFNTLFAEKSLSASSIAKVRYVLDPSFKWAIENNELLKNPMAPVKSSIVKSIARLKEKKADDEDVRILTSEEKAKAWSVASERWPNGKYKYAGGLHFKFLVETGPRVGEWIALRWEDYDFENRILRINKSRHLVKADKDEVEKEVSYIAHEGDTKNSKARNIVLSKKADGILREIYELTPYKKPTDYICLTRNGKNYTATSMEHIVQTVYRNAGISDHVSGLHILRRTFATELFDKGYSIKEIAAYLGDNEETVSRYYVAARKTKEVKGKRIAVVDLNI